MARTFGNTEYINLGSPSDIDAVNPKTIAFWFKPSQNPTIDFGRVLTKEPNMFLTHNQTNSLFWDVERAGVDAVADTVNNTLTNGVWHKVVVTYDDTDGPRIFVSPFGTKIAEVTYSSRTVGDGAMNSDAAASLLIGNRSAADRPCHGDIADIKYINKLITNVDDLESLFLGKLTFADSLVGWWPFSGVDDPEPDWSQNGNQGVLNNSPAFAENPPFSPYSDRFNASYLLPGISAPSSLSATADSATQITITWTDNSNNEDNFELQRKTGAGSYSTITSPAANAVSYIDTGLSSETEYTYRIRAVNADENSDYSNEDSATTESPSGQESEVLVMVSTYIDPIVFETTVIEPVNDVSSLIEPVTFETSVQ